MRFFISFSSKDRPVVREIMAGIQSQNIDFWDYSDENWQIDLNEKVLCRLKEEIDGCDYFVAVVSKNSVDPAIGFFTRFEVDYAVQTLHLPEKNRVLTIELQKISQSDYTGPYAPLWENLHFEMIWNKDKGQNIRSYIELLKRICKSVGIQYIPQITPHHRMPFWERFREEIFAFDHKISTHTGLMGTLGEFNEFFKCNEYQEAYKSINYFIVSCDYAIPGYRLLYPWLVKGITEQFMGKHQTAIDSYKKALMTEENNPDALAGLGQAYRFTGNYASSVECYEKAFHSSSGIRKVNMMLNIIFSKVSGRILPTPTERDFIIKLDVDKTVALDIAEMDQRGLLPAASDTTEEAVSKREKLIARRKKEERGLILAAKALTYFCEADTQAGLISEYRYKDLMQKAYYILKYEFPENEITETSLVFYCYLSAKYLRLCNPQKILSDAIIRAHDNPDLNITELNEFLAEHYIADGEYPKSIDIYENTLTGPYDNLRIALYYALALYKSRDSRYNSVCNTVLKRLPATHSDFYWLGFANFLLGEKIYARHDFNRSYNFGPYYDRLV